MDTRLPVIYIARHGETAWTLTGDVLLFSSGHFIRVLAARWIGLEPSVHSMSFLLSTASLSAVGYEHDIYRPVIRLWNDTHHVCTSQDPT
jgi:broad specificity phosphatase PhoE